MKQPSKQCEIGLVKIWSNSEPAFSPNHNQRWSTVNRLPRFLCPEMWPAGTEFLHQKTQQNRSTLGQRSPKTASENLVKPSQHWNRKIALLSFARVDLERDAAEKCVPNKMRRERDVWRWVCPNEDEASCIYRKLWGWIDVTVGLLSLHKFVGRPWKFVHNQNKFITSFVHVKIGWPLDQSYTSQREESKKNISCHK